MSETSVVDKAGLVTAAGRYREVKIAWLQTYVLVQKYLSYARVADILGIHPNVVRERVEKLEAVYGFVLFTERLKDNQPLEVQRLVASFKRALSFIEEIAPGQLSMDSARKEKQVGNITVDDMRTMVLMSTKVTRREVYEQLAIKESTLSRRLGKIDTAFSFRSVLEHKGTIFLTDQGKSLVGVFCFFIEAICEIRAEVKIAQRPDDIYDRQDLEVCFAQNRIIMHLETIKPVMRKKVIQLRRAKIGSNDKKNRIREITGAYASIKRLERRLFIIFYFFRSDLLVRNPRAMDMAFARMKVLWKAENIKVSGNRLVISPQT